MPPPLALVPALALLLLAQLPGIQPPAPDPAPGRIAYVGGGHLRTIAPDGSERAELRTGRASSPAWSPDGETLAFSAPVRPDDDEAPWRIRLVGADGTGERTISPPGSGYDGEPSWSPDGSRLVFSRLRFSERAIVSSLVVVNADGSGARTLLRHRATRSFSWIGEPAWSPRGERILFSRTRLNRRAYFIPSLHTIASEGGGETLVARAAASGAWSPDGARIAYSSVRDRNGDSCGSDECSYDGEIYVAEAGGANPRRLTAQKGDDTRPSWSPDGRWVAFSSDRNYPDGDASEIYAIRDDGSCQTWLTNGTAFSAEPAWQPGARPPGEPSGCGATPREPLLEVDLSRVRSLPTVPVYWLGERHGNLLLSHAGASRRDAYLLYADCAAYDPAECPEQLEIATETACSPVTRYVVLSYAERLLRMRGVLAASSTEGGVSLFSGRSRVTVLANRLGAGVSRPERDAVAALRRLDEQAPSGGDLPRTALPASVLASVRRTVALHRRLGSVRAVHRRLGISQSAVRKRLRLARALRALGRVDTLRCRGGR